MHNYCNRDCFQFGPSLRVIETMQNAKSFALCYSVGRKKGTFCVLYRSSVPFSETAKSLMSKTTVRAKYS